MIRACPICNNKIKAYKDINDTYQIECKKCGQYHIDKDTAQTIQNHLNKKDFYKLSSWVKEQNIKNTINKFPTIDEERFQKILNEKNKKIIEKFDKMILYLSALQPNSPINEDIITRCWMRDKNEFIILYKKAITRGYIEKDKNIFQKDSMPVFTNFTYDGLEYLEALELEPNKHLSGIFVAYKFNDDMNHIFETYIQDVVRELGFEYIKVDQTTTALDQKITDEIISKLKHTRFIIADFTHNSENVYFEAGYAMGQKIPVIWSCKEGHEKNLSFDTSQYPHIIWKNGEDFKEKIKHRIMSLM